MAHIERRAPGKWRARYRAPDGRERSCTFARKADAEVFLAGVEADMARGQYLDPAGGRRTFDEQAWEWRAVQLHRPTTAAQVDSHLRHHVLPFFGARPLASIRPSEIQAWVKDRSAVLAPATVEVVYQYLAAIFRSAVEDRLLAVSPCRRVKLPKRTPRQVEPLATEDVHRLIEVVPDRFRALIVLTAGTGVRPGEAFGLTLQHLDMLRRQVRIEQQLILLPGRPPFLAPPKTAASHRTIPLPTVVDALAEHLARFGPGNDDLVFTTDVGGPIRRTSFSARVWIPSVARAGLPRGTHDLRHYYASLLIRHGESVKVVQARLGHATAAETLDTYSHLWPDSEDRTRQAVDEVLGRAPAALARPAQQPET